MPGSRTQLRQEIEADLAELKAKHAVRKREGAYTPAGEREVDLALANVERLLRANKLKGAYNWIGVVYEEMIKAYSLRDNPPRSKSGPAVERAVKHVQKYLGAMDRAPLRVQDRLYQKAMKSAQDIAKSMGMLAEDVWNQLEAEARRRGITPGIPGKDW